MKKTLTKILAIITFSILSSQCFAQSKSKTADKATNNAKQYIELLNSVYYYIQQNYVDEVDPQVLYEGALKGMLDSLQDPYTTYLDQPSWRSLTDTTVGNFGGVGLSISKPVENTEEKPAYVLVAQPIDNSPGFKAGIQSGDLIIKIEGQDTAPMTMEEVLGMLRGTVGESVTVTIRRGKKLEFDRTLVRAVIENPTVKYGTIGDIGYIKLTEFSSNTADRVQDALDSFEKEGYKGLILDLRYNGGGLLSSAVNIADKFIDQGPIVSTKSRIAYENSVYSANPRKTVVHNVPVIVLINGASASASEILSGALKDTKKAILVGEKTYGKGSVQVPTGLINKDGFKITVAKYYSPSDTNIDKTGIKPDVESKFPEFTEEQEKSFVELVNSEEITGYAEKHPDMTETQIAQQAKITAAKYHLEERYVRKLYRNEADKAKPSRLYDLDYDIQLNDAIEILKSGRYDSILAQSKTLKELAETENQTENKAAKESK